MRLHRSFAVLLLGLPMAAPIAVVAEDASLAPEVQRGGRGGAGPPIRGSSGRSRSEFNRSSPRGEASWAFISTTVPTSMPTAARSAVSV